MLTSCRSISPGTVKAGFQSVCNLSTMSFSFARTAVTLLLVVTIINAEKHLKLIQVLFRHGDRSPVDAYPTSKYQEGYWPNGFDALTQEGMRQHYELGEFFKKSYVDDKPFLNASYSHREIEIWSTDIDRTLMSAAVDLAGLFPPSEQQTWNPDIPWQPIPVHTMPVKEDYYLSYQADCPTYDELQKASLNDKDYVQVSKDNAEFMKKLNTDSGFNGSITVTNIFRVSDPLHIEKWKNLTMQNWTKEAGFWPTLEEISAYSMGQLVGSTDKARLRGGPLLGLMIKNIQDMLNTSQPSDEKIKFHMYSAHDVTITSLMSAMKVFNGIPPPYASAVIVELYNDSDSGPFVRISYRNSTKQAPYVLTIPDCNDDCPFTKFVSLTKERTLAAGDIRRACGLVETPINYWIPTIIGLVLGVMLVAFVAIYIVAINHKNAYSHRALNTEVTDP